MTPTPRDCCHWEVHPILFSAPLIIRLNHLCWVGHDVIVILALLNENVEPSFIPIGKDSHADEKVLLGFLIKSNCICFSPFMRGTAVKEWNSSLIASPMPMLSPIGIGPRGGIDGVFLKNQQLLTPC
jgi:hypothetical protein